MSIYADPASGYGEMLLYLRTLVTLTTVLAHHIGSNVRALGSGALNPY